MQKELFSFHIECVEKKALSTVVDTASATQNGDRFLQSNFWASFKSQHGWTQLLFSVQGTYNHSTKKSSTPEPVSAEFSFTCSVLVRRFARFFSIAYIPMGPDIPLFLATSTPSNSENACLTDYLQLLAQFSKQIRPFLPKQTLCVRADPPIDFLTIETRDNFIKTTLRRQKKLHKPPTDIQPPDTTILDLSKSEEELLATMKAKWRYNIRLSEKKGVEISSEGIDGIDTFYALYEETSKRDAIAIHSKNYYKSLFELGEQHGKNFKVSVYIAKHEGDALAAIITLFTKTEAVYLYGASSNAKRNLMATYLLQWKAIQDAKHYGSKLYDFYGMPPTDDENHPMHGLYRFKTGFGGTNIHRPGSIDVMLSPIYLAYIFAEKLRGFYYKRIKKRLVGR